MKEYKMNENVLVGAIDHLKKIATEKQAQLNETFNVIKALVDNSKLVEVKTDEAKPTDKK